MEQKTQKLQSANSHTLRISGLAELSQPLEIDNEYTLLLKADIYGIQKKSNQDGSFTYIHQAKLLTGEVVEKGGKVLKIKDKRKQSTQLRFALMAIAREKGIDEEDFYQNTMTKIRIKLEEILNLIDL